MKKLFAAVAYLTLIISSYGQIATITSLVGTVSDSSGRAIAGARITAVDAATLDKYSGVTNQDGNYRIEFVRVGTYDVSAEYPGFTRVRHAGSIVEINQIVRNDFTLSPGSVQESITVEASAPVIKTDDATISATVTSRQIADLPLNGRNALMLATTTPGVLPGTKGTQGVPPGQDFIGAGTREIQNSMSLDGISIMNNLITTSPTQPMVETVQEVEVQTGTYSAQYGAYLGVHLNMVTKSGTNAIHGNLVEFIRNDAFDARGYFLPATSHKTALRQNQYGFEVDGPVVIPKLYNGRDKTFFMGSWERLRNKRQSLSANNTVMTEQMFAGDFSQTPIVVKDPLNNGAPFPGNIVPTNRLSPIALALQQYYVKPTSPNLITQNFTAIFPAQITSDQTVDRVDQNIGYKARLFFRYQRQKEKIANGSAIPYNAAEIPSITDNYTAGYTHTITPTLVNDFRIGRQAINTDSVNYFYVNGITDAGTKLGIAGFDADSKSNNPGTPEFNVSGFAGWGNSGTNWFQLDHTWQASEQISWTLRNHSVMAGAELRKLYTSRSAANSPRGVFNFNGQFTGYAPADFMMGFVQNLVTPTVQYQGDVATWRDGFFVLDNWQASRKLTVNYGIRYELQTVPYSVAGYARELNAAQTAAVPDTVPSPGFRFHDPNHKDFAPRVGLAYRLTEKTVIRAGFGIYYNPNQTNSFTFLTTNPPFGNSTTCTSLPTTPTLSLSNPIGAGCSTSVSQNWITDNWYLPPASMNQWSFGIQRQLSKSTGLDVQYLGSHSYHLDRSYYNNSPYFPAPGAINPRRPNQLFGQIRTISNDLISNYHHLAISVHQRLFRGFQFDASYTWSHALDVTSDSNNGGAPMNPYNWRLDYGNAPFDIRHRFVATYIYSIPFFATSNRFIKTAFGGWQINGITTLQSGTPFNLSMNTDAANTSSQGPQRPDLLKTPVYNCGAGHLTGCIDKTAFAVPGNIAQGIFAYGNAGRNILRGPHMFDTDMSLFKTFPIKERMRFTFRAEAFNIWNNPEFSNPNANIEAATFGNITSTSVGSRVMQLGGKLSF
ncbi:MAG: TonB-dependent receptor [Acidobacteriia bacterium]|nr:TonB-dependent receptor [Terriglobia bacterium]